MDNPGHYPKKKEKEPMEWNANQVAVLFIGMVLGSGCVLVGVVAGVILKLF